MKKCSPSLMERRKSEKPKGLTLHRGSALRREEKRVSFLFLIIPTLILLVFTYYPAAKLIELSFSNWNGYARSYKYIGFENYLKILKDKDAIKAFANTFAYVVIGVIQTFLGLYLAIILNTNIKFKNFFRSLFFIPYVLNGVAVSYMFNYIYNFETNPINAILTAVGLEELCIHWLGTSYFSNFALAFIGLWRFTGYGMLLFLGALQSIPSSHFEAADLDGAGFWDKVRYIIIPEIRPVIGLSLFLNLNGSLQAYDQAFVITGGGPNGATETFVTATMKTAFDYSKFGKASAMGIVLLVIVIIVEAIQKKLVEKEEE